MGNKFKAATPFLFLSTLLLADVAPVSSSAGIVDFYFDVSSSSGSSPKVYVDVAKIQREISVIVSYTPRMKAAYACFGTNGDICPVEVQKCDRKVEITDGYGVAVEAFTIDYASKNTVLSKQIVYEWREIGQAIIFTRNLDQANWCYASDGITVIENHNLGYIDSNGVKACGKPELFEGKYETRAIESSRDWHTNWFVVQAYMPKITQTGSAILFTGALDQNNWCFQPSGSVKVNHNLGYMDTSGVKACGCNSSTPIAQAFGREISRDWHTNWFECFEYETTDVLMNACPTGYETVYGSETAKGECKKMINYTYHNYLCSTGMPTNTGGDCNKLDPSGIVDNSATLSAECNSPTPPAGNCVHSAMACPIMGFACKSVPNSTDTYCSPIDCDTSSKCQVAQCSDIESARLGATNASICGTQACDASKPYNGYCGQASCPSGFGVYSSNGHCYQDVCPAGSIQQPDGSCQQLKCPNGTTEVGGVCANN